MSFMEITREMWIGAGALAFIGAVVWMVPPTTPVAPMASAVRPRVSGVAKPPIDAPAFAASAPPPVATPGISPTPVTPESAMPTRFAEATPPRPRWREVASADRDDEDSGSPEDAFDTGYRWAEANDIAERRDCRRWRSSPAEAGCRAYLRDSDDREPGDGEDQDVAREPQ